MVHNTINTRFFSIFPFLQTNITSQMWPSGGKGAEVKKGRQSATDELNASNAHVKHKIQSNVNSYGTINSLIRHSNFQLLLNHSLIQYNHFTNVWCQGPQSLSAYHCRVLPPSSSKFNVMIPEILPIYAASVNDTGQWPSILQVSQWSL